MRRKVRIGNKLVGDGEPTFIIAEIGINHNGDIQIAKRLIDMAVDAGCDAVKFQKRTISEIYTDNDLDVYRESPWGTTNRQQKEGLELDKNEYNQIDAYCKKKGIIWFASCWDKCSVDFIDEFNPPCYKVASPSITDHELLKHIRSKGKPIILSTGMSTVDEIKETVKVLGQDNLIMLHCTSTYPSNHDELNLNVINKLKEMFPIPIGYSGHEVGVFSTVIAVTMGACIIERHITLDRVMYGSDQVASLEPKGLKMLVRDTRLVPSIKGNGIKKVYDSELPIREKLRRIK